MVIFFFKFIAFRVLENALVNQKIRSRHFFSYLLSRALPKVFIIPLPPTAVIREFQKHKVSHVTTFSLILPDYHFPNVYFH